jgi:hypothetical protein
MQSVRNSAATISIGTTSLRPRLNPTGIPDRPTRSKSEVRRPNRRSLNSPQPRPSENKRPTPIAGACHPLRRAILTCSKGQSLSPATRGCQPSTTRQGAAAAFRARLRRPLPRYHSCPPVHMRLLFAQKNAPTGPTRSSPRHRLKPSMPKSQRIDFKGKIGFVRSVLHLTLRRPPMHNSAHFRTIPRAGYPRLSASRRTSPTGPATRRNHAPHPVACPPAPQIMRHYGSGRDSAEESRGQLDFRINLILSCG